MRGVVRWTGLTLTLILISCPECLSIFSKKKLGKKLLHDAAIYPGVKKSALKLLYSDVGDFSNLKEAVQEEGFIKMGLFCIKNGAFILYKNTDFDITSAADFKIASGENKCFKPSGLYSAQPLGSIDAAKADSIAFFSKPNFASVARPTTQTTGRSFFASMRHSAKSLIVVGTQNWTITTLKGKTFCIRPKFDKMEKHPICVLPDFRATRFGKQGIHILRVVKGCKKDMPPSSTILASYCNYWGTVPGAKEDPMKLDDGTGTVAGRTGMDSCSGGGDKEAKLKQTLSMLKAIFTDKFDAGVILEWKDIGRSKWKLELLDVIFDIAKMAAPTNIVSGSYLNRIRELFIYQLGKAWARNKTDDGATASGNDGMGLLTEFDFRGLMVQTQECMDIMATSFGSIQSQFRQSWLLLREPSKAESLVWKGLVRQKSDNIVIEMTWVIANLVGGVCHKLFNYKHNYWALYIHMINNLYLIPVIPEWKMPIADIEILLGGDMDVKYNQLALFASLALFSANGLEPFQRPGGGADSGAPAGP